MVLKLRENPPDNNWEGAKCHKIDIRTDDPFFSDDEYDIQDAADFCNGTFDGNVCPIRDKCMLFALTNNEKFGVWGGTTPLCRKAIRKKYPSKGGKKNEQWHWMTEEKALEGLSREKLKRELDEELRSLTED
jgi:hypothetical protein